MSHEAETQLLPANQGLAAAPVTIGHYQLHETLGRGGMGIVWKATHINLGKTVAIKLLAQERSQNDELIGRVNEWST